MDNDRILVMDAGKMVEFGHPFELIQNENSHLRMLIDQTGPSTAQMLMGVARESYNKKSN
jgi:ABC-type transport system involved in cytochrome bd biosynthesis fused ATPase/permease subunit